jgi:hypothetical protein
VSEPILVRLLPVQLTNGNDGRGSKWFNSAKRRSDIEKWLFNERRTPFDSPVKIRITRILGARERLWDADSVGRGNAKEIVDSLTALGWWKDDGPRWITHCEYRQDASQRKNGPATLVEVFL